MRTAWQARDAPLQACLHRHAPAATPGSCHPAVFSMQDAHNNAVTVLQHGQPQAQAHSARHSEVVRTLSFCRHTSAKGRAQHTHSHEGATDVGTCGGIAPARHAPSSLTTQHTTTADVHGAAQHRGPAAVTTARAHAARAASSPDDTGFVARLTTRRAWERAARPRCWTPPPAAP
jgi:hypothetical protein